MGFTVGIGMILKKNISAVTKFFLFKKSIILCEDFWEINILCYCYKLPHIFPEVSQGVCRSNAPGSWILTSVKQKQLCDQFTRVQLTLILKTGPSPKADLKARLHFSCFPTEDFIAQSNITVLDSSWLW